MGLLLLSVVVSSQPEAFHPHQRELLQLLNDTLGEVGFPGVLFYSLRTLTALAPYLRTDDVVRVNANSVALGLRALMFRGLGPSYCRVLVCLPFFLTVEGDTGVAGPGCCTFSLDGCCEGASCQHLGSGIRLPVPYVI